MYLTLHVCMYDSYIVKSGVIYMCLADSKYPQKLALTFLSQICDAFVMELQNTYGTSNTADHKTKIDSIDNLYAFIKFGKFSNNFRLT